MKYVAPYAKAIVAAVLAGLFALSAYLVNDTSLGDLTAGQWVQVAIAFLTSLGAVWATPWRPAASTPVAAPTATKASSKG